MRRAMAEAEVGDEQQFADPTVNALCERVAELLGFEAAVFLPAGTMCNEIAFRLHIAAGRRRGATCTAPRTRSCAEAGGPGGAVGRGAVPARRARAGCSRRDALRGARCATPGDRYAPRSPAGLGRADDQPRPAGTCGRCEQLRAVLEVARGARAARCTWTARG